MIINVAKDFSTAPGPRYRSEGKFSGEEFRCDLLFPKFQEVLESGGQLTVELDGTAGYGTSFLEESFGGLIRENHLNLLQLNSFLKLVSLEEPELLVEINDYMRDAADEASCE